MKRIVIDAGSLPELVVKPKVRFDDTVLKALKEDWTNKEFSIKLDKLTNNQIA